MGQNERTLCPACGAEMQEFHGQYFCLDCGNEYKEETDDFGKKSIVLTSGNPLRDNAKNEEAEAEAEIQAEVEPVIQDRRQQFYEEYMEEKRGNGSRVILIGVLVGIITLAMVVLSIVLFNSCDSNKEDKTNDAGYVSVKDDEDDEEKPVVEDEEKEPEDEEPVEEEVEEEPEEKPKEEPKEEPERPEANKPKDEPKDESEKTEDKEDEEPAETLYRVRKSADDAATQLSAYRNLESAKKDADDHKDEGYKVYDQDGKLIYTP